MSPMRTTLTLDRDVAQGLQKEMRRTPAWVLISRADFARFPGLRWVNPLA